MKRQKTSLFVIVDPTAEHQVALVKALLIAKLGNCHIHAFLCTYRDVRQAQEYSSRKDFKHRSLEEAEGWLEGLMEPCLQSGVSYTTEVIWNSKWVESAIRAIEKSACDLIVKSSFHHSKALRFFSKTSDYHLIHHCASPILFTHQGQDWRSDRLLACLDLESTDPQHARLNGEIIRDARAFADIVGMDLYIACAYSEMIDSDHLPIKSHGEEISQEQLGELYNVDPTRILLRQGSTIETLCAICEEIDPSIVILGSIARSGISGKLIGTTAEKLLDLIDADLLTVN
ncbi:MAG: universal stress protein [Gammaproteobacteria bacterium]|nr:universal stress protein [Gammaproteobacteria bacterium]